MGQADAFRTHIKPMCEYLKRLLDAHAAGVPSEEFGKLTDRQIKKILKDFFNNEKSAKTFFVAKAGGYALTADDVLGVARLEKLFKLLTEIDRGRYGKYTPRRKSNP